MPYSVFLLLFLAWTRPCVLPNGSRARRCKHVAHSWPRVAAHPCPARREGNNARRRAEIPQRRALAFVPPPTCYLALLRRRPAPTTPLVRTETR